MIRIAAGIQSTRVGNLAATGLFAYGHGCEPIKGFERKNWRYIL